MLLSESFFELMLQAVNKINDTCGSSLFIHSTDSIEDYFHKFASSYSKFSS
jgi:hypothetical protein